MMAGKVQHLFPLLLEHGQADAAGHVLGDYPGGVGHLEDLDLNFWNNLILLHILQEFHSRRHLGSDVVVRYFCCCATEQLNVSKVKLALIESRISKFGFP